MVKPILVGVILLLNAFTFFLLYVARYTPFWNFHGPSQYRSVNPSAVTIINWVAFYTISTMAFWSLLVMVFSSPGYVPNNRRYDREKMSEHD